MCIYTYAPMHKLSHSVVSDSLRPYGLSPSRLLCPWDSPGKNTGVGCCALLQGSFRPRNWTRISLTSPVLAGGFFIIRVTWEALYKYIYTHTHTHTIMKVWFFNTKLGSHHFITCSFHWTFHERFHKSLDALPQQQCERLCALLFVAVSWITSPTPRHLGCLPFPTLEAALGWAFSEINLCVHPRGAFRPHFQSEWLGFKGCNSLMTLHR